MRQLQNSFSLSSLYEQGCGTFNEDYCLVSDNTLAVLDGASSLNGKTYEGKSGAWWASHTAGNTLEHSSATLHEKMIAANQNLHSTMVEHGVDTSQAVNVWSTCAAAIEITDTSIDWAQIGDSLIIAIDKSGDFFLPAPYHNHDKQTLEKWKKLSQEKECNIFNKLLPDIIEVRHQMNMTYGVINGDERMKNFLNYGSIPRAEITDILLFTDGLHLPTSSQNTKGDFTEFVAEYKQNGLEGVRDKVRRIEETDPNCMLYPRFKQHDDIAAIALSFS